MQVEVELYSMAKNLVHITTAQYQQGQAGAGHLPDLNAGKISVL
jgi:hypothetical protein